MCLLRAPAFLGFMESMFSKLRHGQAPKSISFEKGRETGILMRFPPCATHHQHDVREWFRHFCGHQCGRRIHHCPTLTALGHSLTPLAHYNYHCHKGGTGKAWLQVVDLLGDRIVWRERFISLPEESKSSVMEKLEPVSSQASSNVPLYRHLQYKNKILHHNTNTQFQPLTRLLTCRSKNLL